MDDTTLKNSVSFWTILSSSAATLGVALAIFAGVGSLTISPINNDIASIHRDIERINLTMAPLLTLYAQRKADEDKFFQLQASINQKLDSNVHDVFSTMLTSRISALVDTNNTALAEISHQVHDLEAKIVSRDENVVHWNATDALALRVNALVDSERQCAVIKK